ncbi:hypothetical protein L4C99_00050, partial [Staphylococcus argenteus]|nr:hypothetical protein [Staphylococcus argenteus]
QNALLVTCALISITVILNLVIPNGEEVFVYITYVATSITLVVWSLIDISYISYIKYDNEVHGTMERLKKDSFYWYKLVIETNGELLSDNQDN